MTAAQPGFLPRFAPVSDPVASVIVTGFRTAPLLVASLRSIEQSRPGVPFEVVVFLNEPAPGLERSMSGADNGFRLLGSPVNLGFGGAVNRAVAESSGEFVVLLNDDTLVEPRWLDELVARARAGPSTGAVGSKIVDFDGRLLEGGPVLWADGSVTLIDEFSVPRPAPAPGPRRVDYVSAVSLLVRRSTWDAVGGMDEGYFPAYCEDVDLCLKIQARGQDVVYQPSSVVRHQQGASASRPYRVFLRDRNTARLRHRWPHALGERPQPAPFDPAAIGRAVQQAAHRRAVTGPGPAVPDVAADTSSSADETYLRRQVAVTEAYAEHLEAELESTRRSPFRRALSSSVSKVKPAVRRSMPGPYRALARWGQRLERRRAPGRDGG